MRKRLWGAIGLVGALCSLGAVLGPISAADPTPGRSNDDFRSRSARLEEILQSRELRDAKVSALVVRDRDGKVLYQSRADRKLIPASNVKILTAVAALDGFGPAHRFETRIWSDRPPDAEGRVGQLGVRGAGDPAINAEDWWRLAAELRATGLRQVTGDLVLDDSALDRERWNPTLKGISSRAYHGPVGALNVNYGAFAVTTRPGEKVGDPLRVEINPAIPYLRLANRGTTTAPGRRRTLVVDRIAGEGDEVVRVRGTMRQGDSPKTYYRSVLDPTKYAGSVFRMQLEANGIEVGGKLRLGRMPAEAYEILEFEGRSVAEIVDLFMKYSNNVIGETLVKGLGAAASAGTGSWENGVPEMRRRLVELGVKPEGFDLVDGSGLSYENRASPWAFVQALRIARNSFRFGPEFGASLPIAGRDGTLKKRTRASSDRVRGKTGLLNQTSALSGYAWSPVKGGGSDEHELLLFSILVNDYTVSDERAMGAIDRFVSVLTEP